MATDPNQILATAAPAVVAPAPTAPLNPWFGQHMGGPSPGAFGFPQGGFGGLLQAAQSADPNAWASFLQQPWAQHLQQRFGLTPDILSGLQQQLAAMNAPHDARQYFRANYGPQPGQPQVGMVNGVPGSMGTNPGAGGQGPIMQPGPVMAPPQQQQQGFRTGISPMLPQGFNPSSFAGFGGGGMGAAPPIAGVARSQGTPGFGL